jgi:hypothetical protein
MTLDEMIAQLRSADEIFLVEDQGGSKEGRQVTFVEAIRMLYDRAEVHGRDGFEAPRIESVDGRQIIYVGPPPARLTGS